MSLKKSKVLKLSVFAILAFMFTLSSCSKYEDGPSVSLRTKTARLTGEWNIVKIDNIAASSADEFFIIEFQKDGGFVFTYSSFGFQDVMTGSWDWSSSKESVTVILDGSSEVWNITRLTNDELWFTDVDASKYECEKK